ncbi:butyryl-CoA:acetate CoA-transferase [Sesbania bispinosa]|nr:butyryl-CoA:acetate CoA-transferase [Sesbania bispinosa]
MSTGLKLKLIQWPQCVHHILCIDRNYITNLDEVLSTNDTETLKKNPSVKRGKNQLK